MNDSKQFRALLAKFRTNTVENEVRVQDGSVIYFVGAADFERRLPVLTILSDTPKTATNCRRVVIG